MRFAEFSKIKNLPLEKVPESFRDINGVLNVLDYIQVVEAEISGKLLSEDLDQPTIKQVEKLLSLSVTTPVVGNKYIPAFAFYTGNNQMRLFGSTTPLELLEIFVDSNGITIYQFEQNKKYPDTRLSNTSYSQLFVFDNISNFNKFIGVMTLRFNVDALRESKKLTEATVGREYQHLEDLVFVDGSEGALRAADILDKLGSDSSDVSVKYDGIPTIYWGRDDQGQFVLVNKNAWGRTKATSPEELEDFINNTGKDPGDSKRAEFASSMSMVFKIMQQATPPEFRGYVFGDLLYTPRDPFEKTKAGIEFTPNHVKYTVSSNSELGKRIAASRVGVVVHTKFGEFGSKNGTPITDVNELASKDAVVLGQTYVTHQPEIDTSGVDRIRQDAKKFAPIIDQFLAPIKGLSDMKNIIYTYVNQTSKAKNLAGLETGFFRWLENSKVSANKQKKIIDMAQASPKAIPLIFRLVKEVMDAKDNVIDQLDSADSDVSASTDGVRGGEGYVAQDSKIKLVPRQRWQPH